MKLLIVLILFLILAIGAYIVNKRLVRYKRMLAFAIEYQNKFILLANNYCSSYDRWDSHGQVNQEIYIWLTKNVNQIQSDLGYQGMMTYVGPWQRYRVDNYQILINTLPKFRNNQIADFDIHASDDALLRHIGVTEDSITFLKKDLRNPIIWFREGFKQLLGFPVYLLNWFGILSDSATHKVIRNVIFKFIAGIGALVTFVSGLVTIIQGKEQALSLLNNMLKLVHIK
ncbi:hypothetical protein [Mucilaginibacter sp. L3T2-6]|uniref:hypothetical protein n=1 Tax=Mucilaginibacter sp. L3T2-6 TaxID=3062491 RepID=UPI002676F2CE|nr:hypothetical protein [Mucilaginibacter sp. L3T2-6]MDO3643844.1 hypothetical protein [Mucilaginibacter sp. L3T2-6]MDV6216295.1 hypothetical protein [Mucilaginibacter sp. L3T2-6]